MKNDITSVSTISFCGQALATLAYENQPYVAMRQICEGIGLDWNGQYQRIQRHPVLKTTVCVIHTVANDDKTRQLICLPLAMLNGWLFSIDASRVKPEIKDKLLRYQRECFSVLHNYWFGKPDQAAPVAALIEAEPVTPRKSAKSPSADKIDQDQEWDLIQMIRLITRHFHDDTAVSSAVHSQLRHVFGIANLYDLPAEEYEPARQLLIEYEEKAQRFHLGMRDLEQLFIDKHLRHKVDVTKALGTFLL